jgi:glycosyltransferase involved in cell wall biosynthesis/2-polyprenyl-3-methyl-5-hydroxy-6-metoxy-1,4-benzoquinol methylase
MNVLFVNYYNFNSNSAIHIFHLANQLAEMGLRTKVCVPDRADSVSAIGKPHFAVASFDNVRSEDWRPDLIHAWTPREIVRRMTEELASRYHCPYVVHLEDNEERIVADNLGIRVADLPNVPSHVLDTRIVPGLSHPFRFREFLANSGGVTALMDRLLEFKPEEVPGQIFWPAYDENLPWASPVDYPARRSLGLRDSDFVLVYTGNSHASNRNEVFSLYLAVGLLNRRGLPVKLVRTGTDDGPILGPTLGELRQHCVELGHLTHHHEVPAVLALADALVQPGAPGEFNDYRFPSKLPEFFATGRPVVLPRTNIGRHLSDGNECLLLDEGHALEIAQKVELLVKNPELRSRIGQAGRTFAERNFNWRSAAEKVRKLYDQVQARNPATTPTVPSNGSESALVESNRLIAAADLQSARSRYSRYRAPEVRYATVRDYCDSVDHLGPLATISGDLKDVQRPWVFKAILGSLRPGARLLEIGAGEPIVADLLQRLGYDVTVVDPYDGSGNGPQEYEAFTRSYPNVHYVRRYFSDRVPELKAGSFDCVYSISVLEHVPAAHLPGVFGGIRRFLRPTTGRTIHAIDHVLLGQGDRAHLRKLQVMMDQFGIAPAKLTATLRELQSDPETYFLAPSGHNLWRGQLSYDQFPMRRCVSIHVSVGTGQLLRPADVGAGTKRGARRRRS